MTPPKKSLDMPHARCCLRARISTNWQRQPIGEQVSLDSDWLVMLCCVKAENERRNKTKQK